MALTMMDRRGFLQSAVGFGLALGLRPAVAAERIVVMTSYPQEVISRYVDAFAKSTPGMRVDVVGCEPKLCAQAAWFCDPWQALSLAAVGVCLRFRQ
jgi:hypothetical protein